MYLKRALTLVALAVSLLAGSAVVAPAPAQAAGCDVNIGVTYKSGSTIFGHGSVTAQCTTGSSAKLVLQRERWYGWEDLDQTTVPKGVGDRYVWFGCGGTGTYTYRTYISGSLAGRYVFKESNHLRVGC